VLFFSRSLVKPVCGWLSCQKKSNARRCTISNVGALSWDTFASTGAAGFADEASSDATITKATRNKQINNW
jgi:hypothetical protein